MGQGGAVRAKGAAAAAPAAAAVLAVPRAALGAMLTRSRRSAGVVRAGAPASGGASPAGGAGGADADAAASARYGLAAKSTGGARAQLTLPTLLTLARVAAVPALLAGACCAPATRPRGRRALLYRQHAHAAHARVPPARRSVLPGGAVGQHRKLRHLLARRADGLARRLPSAQGACAALAASHAKAACSRPTHARR